jgi:adenosylmethionine-8-amino-7-oxononanoate aminotransferase
MNAIRAQTEQLDHVILANTTHAGVVDLSERLLALANRETPAAVVGAGEATREARSGRGAPTPRRADPAWHFGKAMYASDGSTGIEIALKLALHAQQHLGHQERTTYAVLAGGYHGETTGALSVSDLGLYADPYKPILFKPVVIADVPWRSGPDDPAWMDASAEWPAIERTLASAPLAAIVVEPLLQAAGGMRPVSPDLLTRLRAWGATNGVFVIHDEIASGFGRCSEWLASHTAPNAQPDIVVLGKGLTAGSLPLGVKSVERERTLS